MLSSPTPSCWSEWALGSDAPAGVWAVRRAVFIHGFTGRIPHRSTVTTSVVSTLKSTMWLQPDVRMPCCC